jgi:hypothetical protein
MTTSPNKRKRKRWLLAGALLFVALTGATTYAAKRFLGTAKVIRTGAADVPSELSTWPWPRGKKTVLHRGVTHWLGAASDGTTVDLFEFDFAANPQLRLELFDQDSDDQSPFDDRAIYWSRGVAQITRQLNAKCKAAGEGPVVAAWNGLFFAYTTHPIGPGAWGNHVSPVVLAGQVHYTGVNHRWSFGVKVTPGGPVFKVFHLPDAKTLEREFDYGGGSAQCLVLDDKPLKLQPFPKPGDPPVHQPVPSTPQEAGHIPIFDHIRTCRTSLGWSKDSKRLYLLFVKEPDTEGDSKIALNHGLPIAGGWTVADVQRFWLSMVQAGKIWSAINSDAGNLAQLAYLRPDGNYMLAPARWTGVTYNRRIFTPDFNGAPQGGSLMYFYVREAKVAGSHETTSFGQNQSPSLRTGLWRLRARRRLRPGG